MNLKKLAILLGIATLCSFASAGAIINISGAQSTNTGVDTPVVQATNDAGNTQSVNVKTGSSKITYSSSQTTSDKDNTNIDAGNTKVVINGATTGTATGKAKTL